MATSLTAGSSTHRVHAHLLSRVLLPTSLEPAHQALLLSQSGPQAAAWLTATYPRTGPPRCRWCKSLFADASGFWAPASAANMGMDAEDG